MSTVFLLLENHFFKTPDGKIWCDRIISYGFLQRYLQSFDQVLLCGRCVDISEREIKGKNLVSGKRISFVRLPNFAGALGALKNSLKVRKIVKKNLKKADCAILRGPSPLSLITYPVFKRAQKPFAAEFVMAADKMFDSNKLLYRILNRFLVKRAQRMCLAADGVSYVTDYTLQKKYPCKKTAFTANYSSIDLDPSFFYQQKWDIETPPKCFNIVHTGYMDSNRKGQDILIDAARLMVDAGQTNFRITFIGDGRMRTRLEKMVSDYKLKDYVEFVGAINDKNKIRDILIKNHLFVFPSRSEGLPRSIIEAMAVGLVCVAPATDGIPELVDKKYLIARDDGVEYAKKIISIMDNWQGMIDESKRNNERAKDFKRNLLDERRKKFYNELKKNSDNLDDKKVTLVISQFSGGGAERVTCNLANYLSLHGYLVDVIALSDSKNDYHINENILKICLLRNDERTNVLMNNLIRYHRLKKYVREHRDITCYVTMLSTPSFMLTSLKKYIKGKIIVSDRNNPASRNRLERMKMEYSTKRCDGLVIQTEEIGDWYKKIKNKIIIPNAINDDIAIPERGIIENKIVAVGRLEKQKNYPLLIDAFKIFSEKHPNYILEIYGQGNEEHKIRELIQQNDLSNKIKLMGRVNNVSEKIVNAKCFVLTSDYEGMPNALIEAMCIGLPCVSTDSDGGGARFLINNKKNGILVQKNSAQSVAMGICEIVENKKLSDSISIEAKKINKRLASRKIYDRWEKYITKICRADIDGTVTMKDRRGL